MRAADGPATALRRPFPTGASQEGDRQTMLLQTIAIDETIAELIDDTRRVTAVPASATSATDASAGRAIASGPGREAWILEAILEKLTRDRTRLQRNLSLSWPVH